MVDAQPRTSPIINSRRARCILAVIEAPVQRECEDHVQDQTVLQMIYCYQRFLMPWYLVDLMAWLVAWPKYTFHQ